MGNCPSLRLIMGSTLIVLFLVLLIDSRAARKEGFYGVLDIPSGNAVLNPKISPEEVIEAYTKVLVYMMNNPKDTSEFMNFLKSSFFTEQSQFNQNIDFVKVAKRWNSSNDVLNQTVNAAQANEEFRKTLVFMEQTPEKSGVFLNVFKPSFFTESAQFNPNVNFANVTELWKGGTFRDKSTDV